MVYHNGDGIGSDITQACVTMTPLTHNVMHHALSQDSFTFMLIKMNEKQRLKSLYDKKYYLKNKDRISKRSKKYRLKNRDRIRKQVKEYSQIPEVRERIKKYANFYYFANKERISIRDKKYKDKPEVKERIKLYKKRYKEKNNDKIKKINRQYYYNNKNKIKEIYSTKKVRERINKIRNERKKLDPQFSINTRLRCLFNQAFKRYTKNGVVGPSKKYGIIWMDVIEYLKPFPEDISEYHIDHIIPLVSFDLTDPKQVKKAFAPENHQWLLAFDNISKGAKIL